MIRRLYVDNYKCLVNFEYKPAALELLFGENGSGKSTVFEVLAALRELVTWGKPTAEVFAGETLTAWQTRPGQTFEVELEGKGGIYAYRLVIEHDRLRNRAHVREDNLRFDGKLLYDFDGQDAHLFHDDFSAGPTFPQDGKRSGVALVPERPEHELLAWFRQRMGMIYVLAIDPLHMEIASVADQRPPDPALIHFPSWYRHLTQEFPARMGPLFESLGHAIDGFTGLNLSAAGETARVLRVLFQHREEQQSGAREFSLLLNQISPGQRCLIALFTILHCAVGPDMTLCIDEPDNFIALREMQPWLAELCDRVEQEKCQCLLISHHPEFIDLLAVKHGVRFTRTGQGPVHTRPFTWSKADGGRPSEWVARGWES